MRDGIAIAKAGIPVVVYVQTSFEKAARAQARVQGAPDLNIYAYPPNSVNIPEAEEAAKAQTAAQRIAGLIEQR